MLGLNIIVIFGLVGLVTIKRIFYIKGGYPFNSTKEKFCQKQAL